MEFGELCLVIIVVLYMVLIGFSALRWGLIVKRLNIAIDMGERLCNEFEDTGDFAKNCVNAGEIYTLKILKLIRGDKVED